MSKIFENRKGSHTGLCQLLNLFYEELFGNRIQLISMCNCYLRAQLSNTNKLLKKHDSSDKPSIPPTKQFEKVYKETVDVIESTFKKAISLCFTEFSSISEPILSVKELNELVILYKTKLPSHYNLMKSYLGFDIKEKKTENHHLVTSDYYDRLIFYQFLSLRNSQKLIS